MVPCYTKGQPSHNRKYTVDHSFSYRSKKFTCACMASSAHAHSLKSEVEILNFSKLDRDGGPLTCKFANGRKAVIQEQGCFSKCRLLQVIPPVL